MKKIKLSKHAVERIIERYGISEENAKEVLKNSYSNSAEIHSKGESRAFKDIKRNLTIIVDPSLSVIITVYESKGDEVLLSFDELLKKATIDSGINCEEKFMFFLNKFKNKNTEMYKKELNMRIACNELDYLLSKKYYEIIECESIELYEMLYSESQLLMMERDLCKKELSNYNRTRSKYINEMEDFLKIPLKGAEGIKYVMKCKLEKMRCE